jgi:tetratricopeptide (TPR) repeat protein
MKSSSVILAVLLVASIAMAQSTATQTQAPSQSGQAQGQTGTQNAAPKNAQAQSPAGGGRVLQAKSQDELKAYQDASAKTDPAEMEAAADTFAAKYPNSEMKGALFVRAMGLYAQSNNSEKLIAAGRKAIAADPTNPVPLVQVASVLAEATRDTDLDREQRLNEAAKDAQDAIKNVDSGLIVPPNAPPEKVAAAKKSILMMAYDTLGMIDLNKKDYAAAEQDLLKAADANKATPEAVIYLRLSVAQDQLKKYPQALDSANKAVQYSPEGSAARNYAKQQQSRVKTLMDAAAAAPAAAPAATAPPVAPNAQPSTQTQPATPPH